jgi:hypothetical protein
LPPRQREALALRELEDLSYDEVADIMGMNRNAVAQLISRARINLRDGLRRGALVSIPAATAECETALPLLALAQDGELDDATSADWLARHLVGCATCRMRVEAMQEAGAAYRLWLPAAPLVWLRSATAQAAMHRPARWSPARRLGALAGVGVLVLVGAGLAAADAVHAPTHLRSPATTAFSIPASGPVVAVHHRRPKPKPKPKAHPRVASPVVVAAVPTPSAAPVPAATPTPTPRVHHVTRIRPKPKPKPEPEEPALVAADPPPPAVADPPPADAGADPPPPPPGKPPKPIVCPSCGITVAGPPPVR